VIKLIFFTLFFIISVFPVKKRTIFLENEEIRLVYLDRFNIESKSDGLSEPSGLTLSLRGNSLWTVSDNTKKVFKLNLEGELQDNKSFKISDNGLEGIVIDPTGEFLYMVKEEKNEIIKLNINTQEVVDRKSLSELIDYSSVAQYFEDSPKNKGLEGICWNVDTGSIFIIKEGVPGLLIEVSSNLERIQNHVILDKLNGFIDNDTEGDKLDYSGICYDQIRKLFWIVSDKGQRLFLYSWEQNLVIQSMALSYERNGKIREIKKAEGVVIDLRSSRLYVVSDKEARLYIFTF